MSGVADYDLTKPEEVERWMLGGQYKRGYRQIAAQLAQAMRITEDLRKWANAEPCSRGDSPGKVGSMIIEPAGPEAYSGFEAAQAEVQWFLDDAVRWDDEKGVTSDPPQRARCPHGYMVKCLYGCPATPVPSRLGT